MAAAYHRFYNGQVVAITTTAKTNPEIAKNTPHGNPAGEGGVINKTPGAGSVVSGDR
jgi:hypothetical protein